jgi:hypothetical protein
VYAWSCGPYLSVLYPHASIAGKFAAGVPSSISEPEGTKTVTPFSQPLNVPGLLCVFVQSLFLTLHTPSGIAGKFAGVGTHIVPGNQDVHTLFTTSGAILSILPVPCLPSLI